MEQPGAIAGAAATMGQFGLSFDAEIESICGLGAGEMFLVMYLHGPAVGTHEWLPLSYLFRLSQITATPLELRATAAAYACLSKLEDAGENSDGEGTANEGALATF